MNFNVTKGHSLDLESTFSTQVSEDLSEEDWIKNLFSIKTLTVLPSVKEMYLPSDSSLESEFENLHLFLFSTAGGCEYPFVSVKAVRFSCHSLLPIYIRFGFLQLCTKIRIDIVHLYYNTFKTIRLCMFKLLSRRVQTSAELFHKVTRPKF
jgi:hypothetical protein